MIAGVIALIAIVWWTQRGGSGESSTSDDQAGVANGSASRGNRSSKRVTTPMRAGQKIAGTVLRDGAPVPGAYGREEVEVLENESATVR